ncbi:hypothetical protein CHS0354_010844 [Potamilus streckersoni]|uniref:Uncharacterized protein n=1 Tax=Potamilus streckersoni TaxID=2493646 RepID=A0AAE0W9B1_9BIVA|nr:hypothetical protein CHS0354_010844 [Potamilus streckersoni]
MLGNSSLKKRKLPMDYNTIKAVHLCKTCYLIGSRKLKFSWQKFYWICVKWCIIVCNSNYSLLDEVLLMLQWFSSEIKVNEKKKICFHPLVFLRLLMFGFDCLMTFSQDTIGYTGQPVWLEQEESGKTPE